MSDDDRIDVVEEHDPAAFERVVSPLIAADPVRFSVVGTVAHRAVHAAVRQGAPGGRWWWMRRGGRPVGAGIAAVGWPLHIAIPGDDPAVAAAFAGHLDAVGAPVELVGGMVQTVTSVADRVARSRGLTITTAMAQGVYVLERLRVPSGIAGGLRASTSADADLVVTWSRGFADEAGIRRGPDEVVRRRAAAGEYALWDVGGAPVSMAYGSPVIHGTSRISAVYTPPAHRRNGYAAGLVATLSERIMVSVGRGPVTCMLYTDLANPTSNGVYRSIGYVQRGEAAELRLSTAAPV